MQRENRFSFQRPNGFSQATFFCLSFSRPRRRRSASFDPPPPPRLCATSRLACELVETSNARRNYRKGDRGRAFLTPSRKSTRELYAEMPAAGPIRPARLQRPALRPPDCSSASQLRCYAGDSGALALELGGLRVPSFGLFSLGLEERKKRKNCSPLSPRPTSSASRLALSHSQSSRSGRFMPRSCAKGAALVAHGRAENSRPFGISLLLRRAAPRRSWPARLRSTSTSTSAAIVTLSLFLLFTNTLFLRLSPTPRFQPTKGSSRLSPTCPRCRTLRSPSRSTTSPATAGSRRSSSPTPRRRTSPTPTRSASATRCSTRTTVTGPCAFPFCLFRFFLFFTLAFFYGVLIKTPKKKNEKKTQVQAAHVRLHRLVAGPQGDRLGDQVVPQRVHPPRRVRPQPPGAGRGHARAPPVHQGHPDPREPLGLSAIFRNIVLERVEYWRERSSSSSSGQQQAMNQTKHNKGNEMHSFLTREG